MRTTRSGARRTPDLRVIDVRPRVMARKATALHDRLHDRLRHRRYAGAHAWCLEIITTALARTDRVSPYDHRAWEQFLALLEEHEDTPYAIPACAATANLLGLALFGEPADHASLADLADRLGHDRLARMQHRYGSSVEPDPRLPLTSEAVRRMLRPGLRDRLASHPLTAPREEEIDDACLRAAHALLVQGVDREWTVPVLDSVEELIDIAENGTIVEWRHHIAMVIADAWSPYTERMVELAQQAGQSHTASVIATIIDLCRDPVSPGQAPRRSAQAAYDAARVEQLGSRRGHLHGVSGELVRHRGGLAAP